MSVHVDRYSAIVRATSALKYISKDLERALTECALAAHYLDQCESDLADAEERFGCSEMGVYRVKLKQARRQYWSAVEDAAGRAAEMLEVLIGDADLSGQPVGLGLSGDVCDALARLFSAGRGLRSIHRERRRPQLPSLFSCGMVG